MELGGRPSPTFHTRPNPSLSLFSLSRSTNDASLAEAKRRWVAAGQPDRPEWEELLKGL